MVLLPLPAAALHPAPVRALQHLPVSVSPSQRGSGQQGGPGAPCRGRHPAAERAAPAAPAEGTALALLPSAAALPPSRARAAQLPAGCREPAARPCPKPCLCRLRRSGRFPANSRGFEPSPGRQRGEAVVCDAQRALTAPRVHCT